MLHPPAGVSREAGFDVGNGCTTQGALAARAGRVKRGSLHCRGDKPGLGPAADLLLLLRRDYSALRCRQKPLKLKALYGASNLFRELFSAKIAFFMAF